MAEADETDRPLVTFALFAYNQERFIEEAVAGAFAQDYSPLEIILSDDGSTDRTFEIMQRLAAEYKGPHRIVLNRNPRNLGIGGHVNAVFDLVEGELVVLAAGDDISEARRTRALAEMWLGSDKSITGLFSRYRAIDGHGKFVDIPIKDIDLQKINNVDCHAVAPIGYMGATGAYSARVVKGFPKLFSRLNQEDAILPARAAMIGEVDFVDDTLVMYRVGFGISNSKRSISRYLKKEYFKQRVMLAKQKQIDMRRVGLEAGRERAIASYRAKEIFPLWIEKHGIRRIGVFMYHCGIYLCLRHITKYIKDELVFLYKENQKKNSEELG